MYKPRSTLRKYPYRTIIAFRKAADKRPHGLVRFTLRHGCDTNGCSIDVRGQLRKKFKKKEGTPRDLKRQEGICNDTCRAEKEGA